MKKFFAILMALVMTLSLGAAVFAAEAPAETGVISIENPVAEREYYVYKIFDAEPVDPNANPVTYSYTIQLTSPWFDDIQTYCQGNAHGIKLIQAPGDPNTFVVKIEQSKFNPADFAQRLKEITPKPTPDATLNETNEYQENLPYGYYFVDTNTGTVCSLDTNCPSVEIHDKNEEPPFDKVIVPNPNVLPEVGNLVDFQITGEVPNTVGYSEYGYMITDTLHHLHLKLDTIIITVNGTAFTFAELNANPPAWLGIGIPGEGASGDEEISFEFDMLMAKEALPEVFVDGAPIVITYSAYITEEAIDDNTAINTAKLDYHNNPADNTSFGTVEIPPVVLHVYDIDITKVIAGTETALPGAEFVLYKLVDGVKYYYVYNAADSEHPYKWVSWTTDIDQATKVISGPDGKASFYGVEAGTYYVLETAAPKGYNMLDAAIEVTITEDDVNADYPLNVENSTGSELPSTGGIGTTIFYVIGGLLMVGAAVLLIVRKKMSVED